MKTMRGLPGNWQVAVALMLGGGRSSWTRATGTCGNGMGSDGRKSR